MKRLRFTYLIQPPGEFLNRHHPLGSTHRALYQSDELSRHTPRADRTATPTIVTATDLFNHDPEFPSLSQPDHSTDRPATPAAPLNDDCMGPDDTSSLLGLEPPAVKKAGQNPAQEIYAGDQPRRAPLLGTIFHQS